MISIITSLIAIFLFVLYICEYRKRQSLLRKTNLLKPLIATAENIQDILYYCETKPSLNYLYLSRNIGDFLQGSWEDHMKNPEMIFDIVHPDDYDILLQKKYGHYDFTKPITVRFQDKNGHYTWYEEKATPVYKDGEFIAVIGIFRNINDKVLLQQQLHYNATHDSLTDLHNRAFFQMKMDAFNKLHVPVAIVVIDLDGLKPINDRYGHQIGDQLISEAASCLKDTMDETMTVARIGGDEFAVIIETEQLAKVEQFVEQLQKGMLESTGNPLYTPIQFSIGYHHTMNCYGVMEQLFHEADDKMYQNKKQKRNVSEEHIENAPTMS